MERERMLPFAHYQEPHRKRLQALARAPEWQATLARNDGLAQWGADTRVPPPLPSQQSMATEYLRERNAERVKRLIREGVSDEKVLVDVAGDWEAALAGDSRFPLVFLGFVVTLDCFFLPRCLYCNQTWLPRRLTLDDWKALLREGAEPIPPYVYLTGGEPLQLGAEVWGDDGLVSFATELGCPVNINTNAVLLTPRVALQLVKVGLTRLHISLDCIDRQAQGQLFQSPERMDVHEFHEANSFRYANVPSPSRSGRYAFANLLCIFLAVSSILLSLLSCNPQLSMLPTHLGLPTPRQQVPAHCRAVGSAPPSAMPIPAPRHLQIVRSLFLRSFSSPPARPLFGGSPAIVPIGRQGACQCLAQHQKGKQAIRVAERPTEYRADILNVASSK